MGKRLTTEEFIEKAKAVHGDKYDYSKVNYVNYNTKVTIICPKHDNIEFEQLPRKHLEGCGCPLCGRERNSVINKEKAKVANSEGKKATTNKKLTTEEWVKRAQEMYGDKYDYSKVEYTNNKAKVLIRCKTHNIEFSQTPRAHLLYEGCPECQKKNKKILDKKRTSTKEEFIEKAKAVHGDTCDYSKVDYVNANTKVLIRCKKHDVWYSQTPQNHLEGKGCPECAKEKMSEANLMPEEEFRKEFDRIYNGSNIKLMKYCGTKSGKSLYKCETCGKEFERDGKTMTFSKTLCPWCSKTRKLTKEIFIEEATAKHNGRYDYSKVEDFKSNKEKVTIICPAHGTFLQRVDDHLKGRGCPFCNESNGEREVAKYLTANNIKFIQQKTFPDCRYKNPLHFDFYLPEKNTAIEYDGEQHYKAIPAFGGISAFEETKARDEAKNEYCEENNIKLIRIKYDESIEEALKESVC